MNDTSIRPDGERRWLSLIAAVGCFLLCGQQPLFGAVALVALYIVAPATGVRWRPAKLLVVLGIYVPFVLVWICFAFCYLRLAEVLGFTITPQPQLEEVASEGAALDGFWSLAVTVVIVAPLCEEILFRGYLFTALEKVLPMWAVQLVTAALFGLAHQWAHAVPIGFLSLFFGYLRQRYRCLFPSIIAHAVHNGVTLALIVAWPNLLDLLYSQ